jgi:hypothetical protein
MLVRNKILVVAFLISTATCAPHKTNIEKGLVDEVINEFTRERMLHHLHGGGPKSNEDFFDRILKRHSLRMLDFAPAFKRFSPQIYNKLLGYQGANH